jgi:hypothetical protein
MGRKGLNLYANLLFSFFFLCADHSAKKQTRKPMSLACKPPIPMRLAERQS